MKRCKHGQYETENLGGVWVAKCLNCGTKSEVKRGCNKAIENLKSIKGPELKPIPVQDSEPYYSATGRRLWSCSLYPETKVQLQTLARELEFNGVIGRALVALMSVPNEILIDTIKKHAPLYEEMYNLSRERELKDWYDPVYNKIRKEKLRKIREQENDQ